MTVQEAIQAAPDGELRSLQKQIEEKRQQLNSQRYVLERVRRMVMYELRERKATA